MSTTTSAGSIGGTYGLSGSGIDVDSIVKKLMGGEQAKLDALGQKKTVLQWQKTAYNTVYDDLNNFRSSVFTYKLQKTLSPNKVSSSNTAVVTATAYASAADVNHSMVVAQLASGVNLTSSATITTGTGKDTLANQLGIQNSFAMTINNGSATTTLTVNPSDSINTVVSEINSAGINVQASYDSTLDRFFLATTNTGSSTQISMSSSSAAGQTFITGLKLGLTTDPADPTGNTLISAKGQDAVFQLDGTSLTESTNTFTISGVTYNLTGTSAGAAVDGTGKQVVGGQSTTVSVTSDIDTAVANVQSFVDSYNKMLAELNSKVSESRYTDYPPLTDAQKAAMKDADITAWTAKAKSGMLHNDTTLNSLINTMRNAVANPVTGITGTYNSAASIGITTGSYTEGGKLYLDTDKLRTALQANPNVLNQLFGSSGTTTVNGVTTTNSQSEGIAGRLYDGLKTSLDQLNQIAGTTASAQYDSSSNIAKEITAYNMQISNETNTFNSVQSSYYKQYNAMEVALQQLSSQASWLSSQLGTTISG